MARITSLARRLDPTWPTNRAVLILVPFGSLVSATATGWLEGPDAPALVRAAGVGAGVVFGTWALGRELAPDDQRAAFVAMAFGFAASLFVPHTSLALLFAALFLARLVNRTVGPSPTLLDGIAVLMIVGWAAVSVANPDIWLVAALAFALDARYPGGRARQWVFAASCVALMGAHLVQLPPIASTPVLPGGDASGMAGIIWPVPVAAVFVSTLLRTRALESVTDSAGDPLSVARVRAGMLVVLMLTARSLLHGPEGVADAILLWSVLAGVSLSDLMPRRPKPVSNG